MDARAFSQLFLGQPQVQAKLTNGFPDCVVYVTHLHILLIENTKGLQTIVFAPGKRPNPGLHVDAPLGANDGRLRERASLLHESRR